MARNTKWPDWKVELLKKLRVKQRLSVDQCARELDTSRGAICGMLFRLGIQTEGARVPGRPRKRKPSGADPNINRVPALKTPIKNFSAKVYPLPLDVSDVPLNERRGLAELTDSCCRWPYGDPQDVGFHFCGRPKILGVSYCREHALRAFPTMRVAAVNQKNAATVGTNVEKEVAV